MSITILQILLDSKRMVNRLKNSAVLADSIISETEGINDQLEAMRQFREDYDALNMLAHGQSNTQMINIINQESPHVREIEIENRELRAALEDQQRALEHIMSKYREHTQKKILNTKINFTELCNQEKNEIIKRQSEKINEMTAIMQKAVTFDDDDINAEMERLNELVTENKGLREMLQISQKYGSTNGESNVDKSIQTEKDDEEEEEEEDEDNENDDRDENEVTVIANDTETIEIAKEE